MDNIELLLQLWQISNPSGSGYQLHQKRWPKYLQEYQELKGIWIGQCFGGYAWEEHPPELAHAHKEDGWICLRQHNFINSRLLMLHELAHVLTRSDHNKKWRRKLLSLGGTLDSYPIEDIWTRPYYKEISRRSPGWKKQIRNSVFNQKD